jgi:hypothetical protein
MGVGKCRSGVLEYTEHTSEEGHSLTQFTLKLCNHDDKFSAIRYVWETLRIIRRVIYLREELTNLFRANLTNDHC